jgi:glycosyltransferase involved in cell wall biosynthesis
VLELFAAADAALLCSAWENFPHVLVEALAVGTPVIATDVGGVGEVVHDGENGIVVAPGDPLALGEAISRFFSSEPLAARLRAAAAPSVARFAPGEVYARLEQILVRAAA